ncbi:MAG: hypothetical protein GF331_08205 [Chitinivibrionales bacterium]|nr:hypothetical protein [Chitinivibrionales bacterium]
MAITLSLADKNGAAVTGEADVKLSGPFDLTVTPLNVPSGGSITSITVNTLSDPTNTTHESHYHSGTLASGSPVAEATLSPSSGTASSFTLEWSGRAGTSVDYERILLAGTYELEATCVATVGTATETATATLQVEVAKPHLYFTGVNYAQYDFNQQQMQDLVTWHNANGLTLPSYLWEFRHTAEACHIFANAENSFNTHLTPAGLTREQGLDLWVDQSSTLTFLGHGGTDALYFVDNDPAKMMTDLFLHSESGARGGDIFADLFIAVLGACKSTHPVDGIGFVFQGEGADLVIGPTSMDAVGNDEYTDVLMYQIWCELFWDYALLGWDDGSGVKQTVSIREAMTVAKEDAKQEYQARFPHMMQFYGSSSADVIQTIDCVTIVAADPAVADEFLKPARYGRRLQ